MITSRVRQDDDVEYEGNYMLKKARGKWRVYEDASYYSQTSGGVGKVGKVMRDTDDKPLSFATEDDARKWIRGGCLIVRA